jgi:hypothetical protein
LSQDELNRALETGVLPEHAERWLKSHAKRRASRKGARRDPLVRSRV